MKEGRGFRTGVRMATLGLAIGMGLLLGGDTGVHGAMDSGIDPLEVLSLQVRNNALIVFDTSGTMRLPPNLRVSPSPQDYGGDDPRSRMAQAKEAVKQVVSANRNLMNFGLASYGVRPAAKWLDARGQAELRYATVESTGFLFNRRFADFTDTWAAVVGDSSLDVLRSFGGNVSPPFPIGCTQNVDCEVYFMGSARFRHGVQFEVDLHTSNEFGMIVNGSPFTVMGEPCPDYPPAGLTFDNPDDNEDGTADQRRPWIKFREITRGRTACYYLTSGYFNLNDMSDPCSGGAVLAAVPPCAVDGSQAVLDHMAPEMPIGDYDPTQDFGLGLANVATNLQDLSPSIVPSGLRTGQQTPLAAALDDIRNASPARFPPDPTTGGLQKNFVIFLTDGDDTCANDDEVDVTNAAFELYNNTVPTNQAEQIFIAYTRDVSIAKANKIARAGSGGDRLGNCGLSPTGPCNDALRATSLEELIDALEGALELAVTSGNFSASPGVVSTVFELGVANGADPLDPDTRYNDRSPNAFYIPRFSLPDWKGELAGFHNDGSQAAILVGGTTHWNAGQSLIDSIATPMQATSRANRPMNRFTFSELHGGANARNIRTSAALLKRRIFTSAGAGNWIRGVDSEFDSSASNGSNVVSLWPPSQSGLRAKDYHGIGVAPTDPLVGRPGSLDNALGIGAASSPVLSFADLRDILGACGSSADPDPQNSNAPVPAPLHCRRGDIGYARTEARQILLAWLAGAELIPGDDGLPLRNGVAGAEFGLLLYRAKSQFMYDSTLSQPAVMTPPPQATPQKHGREWILYRDGHRTANRDGVPGDLDLGFGLRNPDFGDANPETKLTLKPRMSVVFYGTNLLLHALNATTAEELWAYLPFDQLRRPLEFLQRGQTRSDHLYGIAASLRLADVFLVPPFTDGGFTYDGRWRTVLVFGRGPGGKHLTALDVTAPGPFTRATLDTNPPWVMWSRGNPEIDLAGRVQPNVYEKMGETWSVPAIGNVDSQQLRSEWRMWVGSGYSDVPDEGRVLYEIEVLSGQPLHPPIFNTGSGRLVASPAAWNSFQLDPPGTLMRGDDKVTRVFVPDTHGHIRKYRAGTGAVQFLRSFYNAGAGQPFTEAVALAKLTAGDFVYAGAGRDTRVDTFPFRIFGIEDVQGDGGNSVGAGSLAFTEDYIDIFRNRTQPAVAFNADGKGRVFFVGQRINPASANCIFSFDTLLFALGAETGANVYDFDGGGADPYKITDETAPGGLSVQGGRVEVPALDRPTVPSKFTRPSPSMPAQSSVVTHSQAVGSPVCRN